MKDADARGLLTGIDHSRPLPAQLRVALEDTLIDVDPRLLSADAPRPLPDDLRQRLEASLVVAAPRPMPRSLRRGLLMAAAAIVAVGVVGGIAMQEDPSPTTDVAGPARTTTTSTTIARASGSTSAGGSTVGQSATVPFADDVTATGGGSGSAGAPSGGAAAGAVGDSARTAVTISVVGAGTAVADGFNAYVRTLNAAGGVGGRQVVTVQGSRDDAVATVNLDVSPAHGTVAGALFETAFVDERRLQGAVTSIASPLEGQAALAVAHAFPAPADGATASVYAGMAEPWATIVPAALEEALRDRGVTVVRVPFSAGAPTFVPADAAFLSLDPGAVRAWVDAAPGAPVRGSWGVGSAWDDTIAARASALSLRVLSPYSPVGGDEEAALRRELPGHALSAAAVHGWTTAKALAILLADNGGTRVTAADLDHLVGWDPRWAPPFEVRPGTRARTPDAVVLEPSDDRFAAAGSFERADLG